MVDEYIDDGVLSVRIVLFVNITVDNFSGDDAVTVGYECFEGLDVVADVRVGLGFVDEASCIKVLPGVYIRTLRLLKSFINIGENDFFDEDWVVLETCLE